ncbi:hypothetical protein [EBPR podovirus 2]|nr:hypothetical protein [EBPR podovirus 2]
MNAVIQLHDHRPVEPLHIVAHRLRVARDVMREADLHRPEFVRECCEYLIENGNAHEQVEAEARLLVMRAVERRHAWCMDQPPAVRRARRAILTEAVLGSVAVVLSASFAVSMIVYVLAMV